VLAKELKRLSERDPLTDLFNKRRLHEELVRQLAILHRYERPSGF
jgi:GGDEF domain-containing protein